MNVIAYSIYLVLSIALTVWVARVLFKNGRVFLVDAFKQNAEMADSINHLLVVGFYLINMGWVLLAMVDSTPMVTTEEVFMFLSTRLGVVLLILGGMRTVTGAVLGTVLISFGLEGIRFMETGPELVGIKFPEMLGLSGIALGVIIVATMALRPGGIMGNTEIEQVFKRRRK